MFVFKWGSLAAVNAGRRFAGKQEDAGTTCYWAFGSLISGLTGKPVRGS